MIKIYVVIDSPKWKKKIKNIKNYFKLKQKKFKPSDKEIKISEFKEKYGANFYPKSEFKIQFNFSF